MLYLAYVLEFVVDGLYHRSLAECYFVRKAHQAVLHVVADIGDQMDPIHEQDLGQFLGNVSLVSEQLTVNPPDEPLVLQWLTVIDIGGGNGEAQDLAPVIDNDMELETVEPSHGGLAHLGQILEHFVVLDAFVPAHPHRGGVHKGNARTAAHTTGFQEHGKGQDIGLHQLGEPIVGNRPGKLRLHVLLYVMDVEVFEAPEPAQVKNDRYGDNLGLGHDRGPFGSVPQAALLEKRRELLAKLIRKTKNIRNFIEIDHRK